jgi:hypothetical protein
MIINDLRSEVVNGRKRVAATIIWEDADRPAHELYFETDEELSSGLSCNPHAFLVGSIIPAMYYGEKRLAIDAEICPELRAGLVTAMSWLRHWYYEPGRELVRIEAGTRSSTPKPRTPDRAGFFFSGGVDAFTTLRANRLNIPEEHPGSIQDGVLVFGLEMDDPEMFRHVLEYYENVSRKAGITLVPIYTNLYLNYRAEDARRDFSFWSYQFQGSALASIAHALASRCTVMSIAASEAISEASILGLQNLGPYGTHPLLDPLYSSSDLRIRHDGIELSRLEKTRLIAGWDVALQNLRVCNQYRQYRSGSLNCGRCEKCVRTMLELLALGALDKTNVFPSQNVSVELVLELPVWRAYDERACYIELLGPLTKIKRNDLVIAIKKLIAMGQSRESHGLKKWLSAFDQRYLRGCLQRMKRALTT